ncbi:hypothetical protein GCM10017600_38610 [Streptosporangium carneum]|uniref:Uncharacterized protein n=1 Tax=Streptosporangium carneum TaxID=47481 RepID=A0A9W6I1V3_9ACTN|nr:hypothetical protein GCM10017600_38610 [Streptosporangium carneum]
MLLSRGDVTRHLASDFPHLSDSGSRRSASRASTPSCTSHDLFALREAAGRILRLPKDFKYLAGSFDFGGATKG